MGVNTDQILRFVHYYTYAQWLLLTFINGIQQKDTVRNFDNMTDP